MIGDSLNADIKGANKLGLVSLHKISNINDMNYKETKPDASFDDFNSINKYISNL